MEADGEAVLEVTFATGHCVRGVANPVDSSSPDRSPDWRRVDGQPIP